MSTDATAAEDRTGNDGLVRRRSPGWTTRAALAAVAVLALLLAGCGGNQSTLNPKSGPSHDIATLWWFMLLAAVVVFGGTVFLLAVAVVRRDRPGLPFVGDRDLTQPLVVVFGVAIPVVVLVILFVISDVFLIRNTDAPAQASTRMTISVIGHQWWWEVRYRGSRAVTANEIHIPTGTSVDVELSTADVIHSFWVPQLNRKVDMIPGLHNRVQLYASTPGTYRGQCAEFCGLQHANMSMTVVAQPPAQFRRWLANMAAPARTPTGPSQQRGKQVFLNNACASCHTISGTSAQGRIGPDLSHLMTRKTLAALTIPNTRAQLARWITDPQQVKPGNKMPGLNLRPSQFHALVAYLESLR